MIPPAFESLLSQRRVIQGKAFCICQVGDAKVLMQNNCTRIRMTCRISFRLSHLSLPCSHSLYYHIKYRRNFETVTLSLYCAKYRIFWATFQLDHQSPQLIAILLLIIILYIIIVLLCTSNNAQFFIELTRIVSG